MQKKKREKKETQRVGPSALLISKLLLRVAVKSSTDACKLLNTKSRRDSGTVPEKATKSPGPGTLSHLEAPPEGHSDQRNCAFNLCENFVLFREEYGGPPHRGKGLLGLHPRVLRRP